MNTKHFLTTILIFASIVTGLFSSGYVFASQETKTFVFPDTVQMIDGGSNWIAYCSDQTTANAFCQAKGYDSASSFTSSYIGPTLYNDLVYKYQGGSFQQVGGNGCAYVIDDGVTCVKTTCTDHASKTCSGNAVYWYNSCGTKQDLYQQCSSTQTCSNGTCVDQTITCSSNSDCGADAYTGSLFCQSGNVYQNYKTYTCNNAGTPSSTCSNATTAKLKTTCTTNQTCSSGSCVDQEITCSSNSQCGTSGYTGSAFCSGGDVYKTYKTYTCNNAGTVNSTCSNTTTDKLFTNCGSSQTCSNGSCVDEDIACSSNSDCGSSGYTGSAFCSGNDVYKLYKTYTCNNAGSSNSYCSNSTSNKLITDCGTNQTCSNGSCDSSCTDYSYQQCSGNYLYWYDSCGNRDQLIQFCSNGCSNNSCNNENNLSVQTYSATNTNNSQATLNGYVYGVNNNYNNSYNYNYNNYAYVWFQWGTSTSYGNETNHQTMSSSGTFSQIVNLYSSAYSTYHYRAVAQTTNGNVVYGSDMTFTSGNNTTGAVSITKTSRNLTTGTAFATTTYASPSDVLMFMITIQTTGNQSISNLYVKDTLPSNLIYKNNLIVSGSSNYSGDIISGMTFGTVSNNQTITVTYQVQVADASNFSYGTTTLTSNVSATGNNLNYVPTSNSSVVVTRSAVYGASTVSTGLTNNFWTDSFLLPLMIALAGMFMLKSGLFINIEKWLDSKKSKTKNYKIEKELSSRIEKIRELEKSKN